MRGALATALALHTSQVQTRLVLPPDSAEEAALVPDSQVYRARHLLDVVRQFAPADAAQGTGSDDGAPMDDGWARVLPASRTDPALAAEMN